MKNKKKNISLPSLLKIQREQGITLNSTDFHRRKGKRKINEYVYICKTVPFPSIEIDKLLENIGENGYEGIEDDLVKIDALCDAIDYFNELNSNLVSYYPDETKMVKT